MSAEPTLSRFHPVFEMSSDLGHSLPVALDLRQAMDVFDYGELDEDVANEARAAEEQIHTHVTSAFNSLVEIGRTLQRMKDRLGHGHFRPWITVRLRMSTTHAHRAMRYAEGIADAESSTVEHLPFAVLDKLFAPSFPEDARGDILISLASETPPDTAAVREQVEKAKPSKPKPKPKPVPDPESAVTDLAVEATPVPVAPKAAEDAPRAPVSVEPAASPADRA